MKKTYTDAQINRAMELYKTDKTLAEISKETGMSETSISKHARRFNLPPRINYSRRDPYSRVCQFCRRKIALVEIQYCPYCGKDIREREDILKFDAKRLYQYQQFLPTVDRDKYKEIVDRIVGYFNEKSRKHLV